MGHKKKPWGRRQSDNQAYPKHKPEKGSLPRDLEVVRGTRRKRRSPLRQDMDVSELSSAVDSYLYQLSYLIQRAGSRAEAEEMYDEIKQSISVEIADLIWDDYVDWETVLWGTADREHDIALGIPVVKPADDSMVLATLLNSHGGELTRDTKPSSDGDNKFWRLAKFPTANEANKFLAKAKDDLDAELVVQGVDVYAVGSMRRKTDPMKSLKSKVKLER